MIGTCAVTQSLEGLLDGFEVPQIANGATHQGLAMARNRRRVERQDLTLMQQVFCHLGGLVSLWVPLKYTRQMVNALICIKSPAPLSWP